MPTWPSGSKASTTNVDAGSDSISSARADIKQNFDNVNDIIDTFNISSPTDGDLLQYSSSSGVWEQVASTSLGTPTAYLLTTNSNIGLGQGASDSTVASSFQVLRDPNNLIQNLTGDSASENSFQLTAGTYIVTHTFVGGVSLTGNSSTSSEINGQDSAGQQDLGLIQAQSSTTANASFNLRLTEVSKRVRTITAGDTFEMAISWNNVTEREILSQTLTIFEKLS